MLQSAVTPSKAIQLYQCIVVGFWSVAFNWFLFSFPNFRVPFISIEKEKDRLDCGAEASVVRPIRSSCGFIGGGVDFCGGFGQGYFFPGWLEDGGIGIFRFCLNRKVVFALVARATLDLHFRFLMGCFRREFRSDSPMHRADIYTSADLVGTVFYCTTLREMWGYFLLLCKVVTDCKDHVKDQSGSKSILHVQLKVHWWNNVVSEDIAPENVSALAEVFLFLLPFPRRVACSHPSSWPGRLQQILNFHALGSSAASVHKLRGQMVRLDYRWLVCKKQSQQYEKKWSEQNSSSIVVAP